MRIPLTGPSHADPPVASGERMPLTAAERSARARLGAFAQHSRHDVKQTTQAARSAFERRFIDEVDPRRELPEAERQRRAEAARKAYFARLTLTRLRSRGKKTTTRLGDLAAGGGDEGGAGRGSDEQLESS